LEIEFKVVHFLLKIKKMQIISKKLHEELFGFFGIFKTSQMLKQLRIVSGTLTVTRMIQLLMIVSGGRAWMLKFAKFTLKSCLLRKVMRPLETILIRKSQKPYGNIGRLIQRILRNT
jgi:hypothetical protein